VLRKSLSRSLRLLRKLAAPVSGHLPGVYFRSCNFCGSSALEKLAFQNSNSPEPASVFPRQIYGDHNLHNPIATRFLVLQYLRCTKCGLVFVSPLPKFNDIDKHSFDGERNIVAWKDEDWNRYVQDKLSFINTYYQEVGLENVKQSGRMLDVSCGPGVTLDWFKNQKGWQVTGIDPDLHSQRQAKLRYGLTIQNGLLGDLDAPPESFDVIIMDNSLEHYFDPLGALLDAYRFLRKGGYFCIIVPNADGLSTRYLGANLYWGHWFAYTPRSLSKALQQVGFEIHGLIADQGGKAPQAVIDLGIDVAPFLGALATKHFGTDAAEVAEQTHNADYFSLIAVKPENAPQAPPQESELRRIAAESKVERSSL